MTIDRDLERCKCGFFLNQCVCQEEREMSKDKSIKEEGMSEEKFQEILDAKGIGPLVKQEQINSAKQHARNIGTLVKREQINRAKQHQVTSHPSLTMEQIEAVKKGIVDDNYRYVIDGVQASDNVSKNSEFENTLPTKENEIGYKETNPKDAVGIKKWRVFTTVPFTVIWELGVAMLEGARKYGRHNYRVAGVRGSVYIDAAMGHIASWWEGEDIDPDTGLSHITKAIASLTVLRDAMIQEKFMDDRPPKTDVTGMSDHLQSRVDDIFDRLPDAKDAFLEGDQNISGT